MRYIFESYTDVGGRPNNEDTHIEVEKNGAYFFAVADGLGGHEGGEIASQIALQKIKELFYSNPYTFDLVQAILCANASILEAQEETSLKMRTTIAATYIKEGKVDFAHVGDSRVYAFKDNKIIYQSTDHSASQMAVFSGEIKSSQIREHEDRHILTRVLGSNEKLKVDSMCMKSDDIEALLLCTDGFWEYVLEEDMVRTLLSSKTPGIWLCKMRGVLCSNIPINNDNNTAITIIQQGE